MPLKHLTETFLIGLLAFVIILTGVLLDTLPLLPEGILPWAIAFFAFMLYGSVLYPVLKRDRAEYAFRLLHFLPAGMLAAWLILQMLSLKDPRVLLAHSVFTWGWSLLPVGLGFLFLLKFCLSVLRRRGPRIALLALLFLPFAAVAFLGERVYPWDQKLSAFVWQGSWWNLSGAGVATHEEGSQEIAMDNVQSLAPSSDPREEAWRKRLRAMDERRREIVLMRLARRGSSASAGVSSAMRISSALASSRSSSSRAIARVSTLPTKLPSSGAGVEGLAILLLAGYCSVLHRRQERA